MSDTNHWFRRLCIGTLRAVANPTTIVTSFGPTIISINVLWLQDSAAPETLLFDVLSNPWFEAVREHNIQLYTLFLAAFVFQVSAGWWTWGIRKNLEDRNNEGNWLESLPTTTIIILVVLLLQFILTVWLFLSGVLASPGVVEYYLVDAVTQRLHIPPLKSPITWLRAVVAIMGALLATIGN